jgi:O-antigen biosynthesis protein
VFELRAPHETIDLRAYAEGNAELLAALSAGAVRDAFAHLLASGALQGADNAPVAAQADEETLAKALFRARAHNALPNHARRPIDFRTSGAAVLSVIMAVHDNFALTLQALASLRDNFAGAMEVILVDGGSTDETCAIERYVIGARVLRFDSNVGFLRASNAALVGASAGAVLYLNNDVELAAGAVAAALERLASDERIGAVGAKIIRSHGQMQEAGGIIWRDGMTLGYMRDASPLAPEVNFVRDVDYCSAVFLMARGELLRELEGFDDAFAPAYYEETDLCVRMRLAGYRVVYDPAVVVYHLEYGSSDGSPPTGQIRKSQAVFFRKHLNWLRFQYVQDVRARVFARSTVRDARRLLFIEDTVPLRMIGSGFTRSNDLVRAMAVLGWQVTVYPVHEKSLDPAAVYADFPDTVEVMYDRSLEQLEEFLQGRAGYYDAIWIARTHNLDRVKPVLERTVAATGQMPRCILDTEAIVGLREQERARLDDAAGAFNVDAAIRCEFGNAYFCQALVAVSELEAQALRTLGFSDVSVIGHAREVTLTPRAWKDRSGLLFIGAIHVIDSPNYDSLCWFVDQVLPLVEKALAWETRLTVVGYKGDEVTMERFRDHPRVTLRGAVANTQLIYDAHRVFVAPTRYSAGTPYKVHEAASFGVPVVASELLRRQLRWENGRELLSADVDDPEGFARHIVALYRTEELWEAVRAAAAERVRRENDPVLYRALLTEVLEGRPS